MKATFLVALGLILASGASATAGRSPWMPTGDRTSQPIGHYELCRTIPIECNEVTPNERPFHLTPAAWQMVIDINNRVNNTIIPRTDEEIYGRPEVWAYPAKYGDCEDYALLKRRMLMAKNIPAGDLLITVAKQTSGAGHAVLTLRTDRGDFILDNLVPLVKLWSDTDYSYIKRQSVRNSGIWVSVEDAGAPLVGSIRP